MANAKHSACLLQLTCACFPRTFCAMDVKLSSQCSRPLSLNPNLRSLCRGPYLQAHKVNIQNHCYNNSRQSQAQICGGTQLPAWPQGFNVFRNSCGCSEDNQVQRLLLLPISAHRVSKGRANWHSIVQQSNKCKPASIKWCHSHCRHDFGVPQLHIGGPSSSAYYFGIDNCITRYHGTERH
jgi:hypothetical protein